MHRMSPSVVDCPVSEGNGRPPLRLLPGPDDVIETSARELEALVLHGARAWGADDALARHLAEDIGSGLRRMYVEEAPAKLPPSLAEIWERDLGAFLDPDPFLLRLSNAGMGRNLDQLVGGGLSVGQTCAVVSAGAGIGKTAFLHQIADGVADANAQEMVLALERGTSPSVVPIIFVSEMTTRDLTLRSLARRAGVSGRLLRDPRGELGSRPLTSSVTYGEDARQHALKAADDFLEAARFMVCVDRRARVGLADLEIAVRVVRQQWVQQGCHVPAVLVIVDPVHRLLDPTRPEVEALGSVLPGLLEVAQRTDAIIVFASDTTNAAARARADTGKLSRGDELANAVEMAFRGSYQLLHLPDVALGLITIRRDDESLPPEDRDRLEREPQGTVYAEIVNAKSRWEERGQRAAYFLDPSLFRYRPAAARALPTDVPLRDRIVEFVRSHPKCSESQLRKGVVGRVEAVRETVVELLRAGVLVDHGSSSIGRRLYAS